MTAHDVKGLAIFISVIVTIFALLCADAFCNPDAFVIEEFDSDISKLGDRQMGILNDLVELRIAVAQTIGHNHEAQDARVRQLENELERLHGTLGFMKWVIGIIGILIAPTGIAAFMPVLTKGFKQKTDG